MRCSCLLSYTDHVPLEAINKELSRHESNSQQAIIMELSCEESWCSAGNNQAAEQAGITQHSWQLRSEEHTSELQSPKDLVCRLLLEKKKKKQEKEGRASDIYVERRQGRTKRAA